MASSRLRNKARKPAVAANGLSELMEQHVSREKPYRAGDINRFPICTPAGTWIQVLFKLGVWGWEGLCVEPR